MIDPSVLTRIADLELIARVVVEGAVAGLHRSPFHGYSAEFSQYRPYRPGDDLKYVDWKLFARTDRVYTKQFLETTNVAAHIVMDRSASMGFRERESGPSKLDYARVLAAALAYLIARQGDAVGWTACGDERGEYLPPRGGQAQLRAVLAAMARATPEGREPIAPGLARAVERMKTRGMILVFTDLYEPDEALAVELRRAARIGHDTVLFHLVTRSEIEFPYEGDLEFVDLETGGRVLAAATGAADYRRAVADHLERWRHRATGDGVEYVRVITDIPVDSVLRAHLLRRAH
ncbi:MAG TPA: DUF58 domain-containing protein [Vicinamibacterales bacterium]|nr:DUF58 domain-containing protein [Vicinamibacterales bacterium]